MVVNFAKIRKSAIIPSKDRENAGYDIYANFPEDGILIRPNETKMIPTGIASAFDAGYVAILKERGSTGTKGMGQRSGVIDSGYRGEWFVPITNHNNKTIAITKESRPEVLEILQDDYIVYPYSKAICQAVFLEVPDSEVNEMSYEELKKIESKRGDGALGSSGK